MLRTVRFVLVRCVRVVTHAAQQPHYIPFRFFIDVFEKLFEGVPIHHHGYAIAFLASIKMIQIKRAALLLSLNFTFAKLTLANL
jgi:hypothetical protein